MHVLRTIGMELIQDEILCDYTVIDTNSTCQLRRQNSSMERGAWAMVYRTRYNEL
jgi:hypothetical protein